VPQIAAVTENFRLDAPRCSHVPQQESTDDTPTVPPGLEKVEAETEGAKQPMMIFSSAFLAGDKQAQRPNMLLLTYRCSTCLQIEVQSVTWEDA